MPRRSLLTARQRAALFDLPAHEASLLRYYTLDDEDIEHIRTRRRPENQIGFALQLCAFRYPGRLLKTGEVIPEPVSRFVAAQLGLKPDDLLPYAAREKTRREHLGALRRIYGYTMFTGKRVKQMRAWLSQQAEAADSNEGLVRSFVEECRRRQIILPGVTTVERLCAEALVAAERRIDGRIAKRIDSQMRNSLDDLLSKTVDGRLSRFIWLRQFEIGKNTADMNRLLDRVELLKGIGLSPEILEDIPPHRIKRLRRQGERYFTDGLQDISSDRRLAILAVCVIEWAAAIADAVVETHDRITGKVWREAKKISALQFEQAQMDIAGTLAELGSLGTTLLMARGDDAAILGAVDASCGWDKLGMLVAMATRLTQTAQTEPTDHIVKAFHSFKLYAKRMLNTLDIRGATVAQPLLDATTIIRDGQKIPNRSLPFLPTRSKWRDQLRKPDINSERLWIVAVMCRLQDGLKRLALAMMNGSLPNGVVENGELRIERLKADVPDEAGDLVLDLYRRLPHTRITDILQDVAQTTGFTDAFTHLRTGAPCKDRIGLLNVLLAEGLNIGLSKMAEATSSHEYSQLMRLAHWHVESQAIDEALAMVLDAQSRLPMAQYWGKGLTSSSDGQFFPTTRQGEAMNLINAKYDAQGPGLKAYAHVTDKFAPFWIGTIPATVNEAPYILDGLCLTEIGSKIKEHYGPVAV